MALTAKAACMVDEKSNEAQQSSDYDRFLALLKSFGDLSNKKIKSG